MSGYRRIKSSQARPGDAFFGNWTDLLVGMWSGLNLRADTWTLAASDGLVLRAFQDVDIAVRHRESFALGQNAPAAPE
ncbi:phage major capsid protein [Paracoccus bogoriensis]|uniref:phage major capsid protein n=1 Tax=Paracoccus bogoriensis TaxID=242065 RepID=UPI001C66C85B|nr:phage major capsid protein [Paracoccus bogoriensis]